MLLHGQTIAVEGVVRGSNQFHILNAVPSTAYSGLEERAVGKGTDEEV